jgi:signal transduction histidine kinase/FixJ family two-component response regulator
MNNSQERILVVEDDPDISDLITRQVLKPLGYRVRLVQEAPLALQMAVSFSPDVIIVNLNLTGLSGKDLVVALSAQGLDTPVIVIAGEGMESDVIQAFRVGASDYLGWPIREAEVVAAVERALKQVRARREREQLTLKLNRANKQLQSRLRELTTIMGIGKAVTSIRDRNLLFDKIIEGAVFVSDADKGWLLLRKSGQKNFYLCAHRNLPYPIAARKDQPWDDGISSLVALSGESLTIHGAPLKRFKVARLAKAALVVPVKMQKEVVGLMVVVRDTPQPFSNSNKTLLESLADFASIALVNVHLFRAVEDRARSMQTVAETFQERQARHFEILGWINQSLENTLMMVTQEVSMLVNNPLNPITENQQTSIDAIQKHLQEAVQVLDSFSLVQKASQPINQHPVSLIDLARQAVSRHSHTAKDLNVALYCELPSEPVFVLADVDKINQVLDTLLSDAIRVSTPGEVVLKIIQNKQDAPQISIKDSGAGLSKQDQERMFDLSFTGRDTLAYNQGIGLMIAKQIIKAHGGKLWVASQMGQGSTFSFSLKPALRNNK